MHNFSRITLFAGLILLLGGCLPSLEPAENHTGSADMSRPVVLAGSWGAGFMDGALSNQGQELGFGSTLLQQIHIASCTGDYSAWQIGVTEGLGFNLRPRSEQFQTRGELGEVIDCEGVISTSVVRDYMTTQEAFNVLNRNSILISENYSFPYVGIEDWQDSSLATSILNGGVNPYYPLVASDTSGSNILDDVLAEQPTFFVMWPGFESILRFAASGATGSVPDANQFAAILDEVLDSLTGTGAEGILATIPDVSEFPYFTTIPPTSLDISQTLADSLNQIYAGTGITFSEGENGFVIDDTTRPAGIRKLTTHDRIQINVPLDSMKCYLLGVMFSTLPDRYVLDSIEIAQLQTLISGYNAAIRSAAAQNGLALVDMEVYMDQVAAGYREDGVDFTAEFVSGGFFSLDGLTPSEKGAALVANEFIKTLNTQFGAAIPTAPNHLRNGVLFP